MTHATSQHHGLRPEEVLASREQHGRNILTPPPRERWWRQWLAKFEDPVIRILLIAAVIATIAGYFEGNFTEGIGIIIAVLLATTLAFLNEFRANREFDILNKVNEEVPVKVVRDGNVGTVPRCDLVVGDIALVELGEEVPADGEVLEAVNLQIDESRLTGESVPVVKLAPGESPGAESPHETAYAANKLLRGSMIADGHGIMRVTAVGDHTEIGKTARAAAEETDKETPLTKQLERLSKWIGVFGFGFAALTFLGMILLSLARHELMLSRGEWVFAILTGASLCIALANVWLPIMLDGLELFCRHVPSTGWLPIRLIRGWAAAISMGAAFFVLSVGIGCLLGFIPASPAEWLPASVALKFLHYFMVAVTIIVVAVPEGLAMSVTLSLAYSMRKMTATNNLVRRMHACETIGATTVICTDKTGTLTMNEMRVQETHFPGLDNRPWQKDDLTGVAGLVVEAICVNTTAHLSHAQGQAATGVGNPTEAALLLWLDAKGIDYAERRGRFDVQTQWTFSTERKFMATLGRAAGMPGGILHVKGAPEIILSRCTKMLAAEEVKPLADNKGSIESQLKNYQSRGMRTLGFAYHDAPAEHGGDLERLATQLTWLGFVAIADPVRPDAKPAIDACRRAGVAVKMVTGDNPATAREIARQVGLWQDADLDRQMVIGRDFAALSDDLATQAALDLKVMARARPMDKLRLVRLLRESGQVVAVTGDGVNDAPALNYADVGLAMGKTGTAVAKEASDIILLDDSFHSIVNAILWGRSLYQNIQRFVLFQLTINVAALGIALLGPYLGVDLPLTVMQMLWINLIMDTFAALALATEPPQRSFMDRPPRKPDDFIVTKSMARNIFGTGITIMICLLGLLLYFEYTDQVSDHDKSIFFTIFVLLQFWNLFNARAWGTQRSAFRKILEHKAFLGIAAAILVGQFLIVTFGGATFRTQPLSVLEWFLILASTSLILVIGEVWRWRQRRGLARGQGN